jgi:hypothetical protein
MLHTHTFPVKTKRWIPAERLDTPFIKVYLARGLRQYGTIQAAVKVSGFVCVCVCVCERERQRERERERECVFVKEREIFTWIITNTMHCLSSVYWVITPLYVSGASAAHHQEAECIYVVNGTCYTAQLTASGPADSQNKSITSTICHIYTLCLLMMGC